MVRHAEGRDGADVVSRRHRGMVSQIATHLLVRADLVRPRNDSDSARGGHLVVPITLVGPGWAVQPLMITGGGKSLHPTQ
jgi:hypothetical protein